MRNEELGIRNYRNIVADNIPQMVVDNDIEKSNEQTRLL